MTTDLEWRTFTNKSGKTYDAAQTTRPYAEDLNLIKDALVDGTKAVTITLRSYTTTERDAIATPLEGMLIWNETNDRLEVYTGASWSGVGGGASDVTSGTTDPSGAPASLAARYVNTATGQIWMAIGTSAQSDWREVFLGGAP